MNSKLFCKRRSVDYELEDDWHFSVLFSHTICFFTILDQPNTNRFSCSPCLNSQEGVGKSSLVSTFVSRHFSELVPGIITRVRLPPDPFLVNCTTTIIDTQEGDNALSNALYLSDANKAGGSMASIHSSSSAESVSSWSRSDANVGSQAGNCAFLDGSGANAVANSGMTACNSSVLTKSILTLKEGESKKSTKGQPVPALLAPTSPFRNVDAIVLVYDLDRVETFYRLENHWLPLIERCYSAEVRSLLMTSYLMIGIELLLRLKYFFTSCFFCFCAW